MSNICQAPEYSAPALLCRFCLKWSTVIIYGVCVWVYKPYIDGATLTKLGYLTYVFKKETISIILGTCSFSQDIAFLKSEENARARANPCLAIKTLFDHSKTQVGN